MVRNKGEQTLAEHVALCMYAAFWYVHIYPTTDAIGGWEFGRGTGRRFSKTRFYACVIPVIMELAQIIDEITQGGRFCLLRACTLRRGRGRLIWSSSQEKKEKAAGALPGSARQALAQHGVEKTNNGGVL